MPFQQKGSIRYFTFPSLSAYSEIFHAILTRNGGTSPAPWASLNLGGSVGDNPESVVQNKERALQCFHRDANKVFEVWQVHSNTVIRADSPRPKRDPYIKADIIVTNQPQLTLLMRFADCVPILLYDPVNKAVGLAHAGWQGTVKKAAEVAIHAMEEEFHTHPEDICAAIGPSIGPDHYQVGIEVIRMVQDVFGDHSSSILPDLNGTVHFDLWAANRLLLEQAGVKQIEQAGICTACHTEDWFSHRAEQGKTGRFGAMIGL